MSKKSIKKSAKSDAPQLSVSVYRDQDRLDRLNKRFERDYGFTKGIPPRSPAKSEWEQEAISENEPFMSDYPGNPADNTPYLKKEQALIAGHAHGFGHRGKQIDGALRHSGDKRAHRIGKR